MSQERTEKATPKRREDAKRKGQIARGAELPAAFGFIAAVFAASIFGRELFDKLGLYIQSTAQKIIEIKTLNAPDVHLLFIEGVTILALAVVPIVVIALAAGLAGNFAQGGFTLTPSALMPKADKFNPISQIKRIFGLDSVVNLAKASIKLLILGWVAKGVLSPLAVDAPGLVHAPLTIVASKLGGTLYELAFRCGLLMLAFAFADYGYSWYKHEKSLKMSKQEIRDEYKESEGDPLIKHQRRNAARRMMEKRSIADVPTASVIITNPTHFAVALRYDRDKDAAPIVVAKGADHLAAKIREIARDNDIPLYENPPLARALYRMVEPSQIIPVEFFGAVAEILAYVFRQKAN